MRIPFAPKRVVTAFGGSFASSPRVETPSWPSALTVSVSAARDSSATSTPSGCAARNSADPPGATTREARAAISAVAISSAAPAMASMPRREAASISISSALSSLPWKRPAASTSTTTSPGRSTSTLAATSSKLAARDANMRPSRSGLSSTTVSSGATAWALRTRMPRRMPSCRAACEHTFTRCCAAIAIGSASSSPESSRAACTGQNGNHSAAALM